MTRTEIQTAKEAAPETVKRRTVAAVVAITPDARQ
jgi:hypothetical protein